jgi:S-adenosylmethionine:tRNA ribosyltransferase-isomerase
LRRISITLHVGYGTFQPVRVERVEEHQMEPSITRSSTRGGGGVVDGNSRAPPRESPWARPRRGRSNRCRWPPMGRSRRLGRDGAVQSAGPQFKVCLGPDYEFHLPQSSLLMLVSAWRPERTLAAYREAVANRYRFYSYGDAMLIA